MENQAKASGGIGFCGLLTILFIALKLTGFISWSWWWVLSPVSLPFIALIALIIIGAIFIIVGTALERIFK